MLQRNFPKKHILLVDDDTAITQNLAMLLETRGYVVQVAETGEEALQNANFNIDLILLDLILPDQEGFEVCRKLKEEDRTRNIPIIMLSGKLLSEDIIEGLYIGADDYLTKPFDHEELIARMEAVMRRGTVFNSGNLAMDGEQAIIQEIRKIIDEEWVTPFFQPIFRLEPFELLGLEALCRPNTKSMLSNPEILFKAALQFGFYQELEILSWKKALEYASKFLEDEKLFLNCNPYLVEGPKFLTIKTLFDQNKIKAENVVLEITERSAISKFNIFYKHLDLFRELGFQFAVDDVGGGYASLESIVETKPEVVKIDRHIVRDLNNDTFKKSIVKFIVMFCKENNILCIAEGIETREDYETVKALGVDAGQGYYLYKPVHRIVLEEIRNTVLAP